MPFQTAPVPFKLTSQDMGMPNILNAISQGMELRKQKNLLPYAAPTALAEISSKLAYANLMGPQFLAKLMGNPDLLANIPEGQKQPLLNMLLKAGSGQGTGNSLLSSQAMQQYLPQSNQTQSNAFTRTNSANNQDLFQSNNVRPVNPATEESPAKASPEEIQEAIKMWNQLPEVQRQAEQDGYSKTPLNDELIDWYRKQPDKKTFAENVGEYKGLVEEGQETGKIRARQIEDLDSTIFSTQTNQTTLDEISNILASPEFSQIRQLPVLGHQELGYYARFGTPAQKEMIGKYYTLTGDIIKGASRDFAGAFRKGEQQLLQGMKPGPSDTVDVARGKTESLSYLNKMLMERSRLVSQYMQQYHMNKGKAEAQADKQIDGDTIRKSIHNKINPSITVRNKKTGETKTLSIDEAREMGIPNV